MDETFRKRQKDRFYVKLQQAYISESVKVGTWGIIGYKGPGEEKTASATTGGAKSATTNFTYEDATGFNDNTAEISANKVGWAASNNAKLNDCAAAKNWTVTVGANGTTAGEATFTAAIANGATCTALTPNFDKIGK